MNFFTAETRRVQRTANGFYHEEHEEHEDVNSGKCF
jgi:hypothetical protein